MFRKTSRQKEVIKQVAYSDATDICLFGGSRSSKTFTNVYMIICRAIKCKSSHLITRDTFASAKASIWQDTLPKCLEIAFPNLPYQTNNTDHFITLPNGSRIKLAGLDDAKRVEKLLGQQYSTLMISEANQISMTAVNRLKTRLAEKNELKKKVFYDLNPPKTSCWTYQLFHQKIDPVDGESIDNPEGYIFFKMNPQSNIDNIDKDYLKRLERLPKKEKLRFLYGEYDDDNTGAAVYSFSDDHVTEEAKKLIGTVYVGSDFNIQHNSDVIASQHAHGLYVWDEVQVAGDTFKKCAELKTKSATGATVISDSTGKARKTSGMSDHLILRQAGFNVIETLNPSVTDKIANLNRCFTLGLIKINPRCKKLIRDLKQLKWDKTGQLDQKTDPSLSHLADGLAYLCWRLYPLKNTPQYYGASQRR